MDSDETFFYIRVSCTNQNLIYTKLRDNKKGADNMHFMIHVYLIDNSLLVSWHGYFACVQIQINPE